MSALRHRDYRYLISGFTLSTIGSWAYQVAITVWLFNATGSLGWVSALTFIKVVPGLLLGPYAGVLADRFEKVRLLRAADLLCAALMGTIAVLVTTGTCAVVVTSLTALTCVVSCVQEPAAAALTPLVVPPDDLAAANTLRNVAINVVIVAGPALGALVVALGPVEVAVWLNVASFLASAGLLSRIRTRSRVIDVGAAGTRGPAAQMLVGAQAIFSSAPVAVMVGYGLLATLLYGVDTVLFVAISDLLLGTGSGGYGYLLAGIGVGGLVAAPLVARAARRQRALAPVVLGAMTAYTLPTLLVLVTGSPTVAFMAEVVRGAGTMFVDVLAVTALQRALPADVVGRVFGAFGALLRASILLGSALAVVLLAVGGVRLGVWVAGAGAFAVSLAGLPWLMRLDRRGPAGHLG